LESLARNLDDDANVKRVSDSAKKIFYDDLTRRLFIEKRQETKEQKR
jgi:hypothetical protein